MRYATQHELDFAQKMIEHYTERCKALPDNYFLKMCYRQHKSVVTTKMIGTCEK